MEGEPVSKRICQSLSSIIESSMGKFVGSAMTALEGKAQDIQKEVEKVEETCARWAAIEERIAAALVDVKARTRLNIGGTIFECSTKYLLSQPYSFFTGLLAMDSNGKSLWGNEDASVHFIDRDPTYFHHVLTYLRGNMLKCSEEETPYVVEEFKFYGLEWPTQHASLSTCRGVFETYQIFPTAHTDSIQRWRGIIAYQNPEPTSAIVLRLNGMRTFELGNLTDIGHEQTYAFYANTGTDVHFRVSTRLGVSFITTAIYYNDGTENHKLYDGVDAFFAYAVEESRMFTLSTGGTGAVDVVLAEWSLGRPHDKSTWTVLTVPPTFMPEFRREAKLVDSFYVRGEYLYVGTTKNVFVFKTDGTYVDAWSSFPRGFIIVGIAVDVTGVVFVRSWDAIYRCDPVLKTMKAIKLVREMSQYRITDMQIYGSRLVVVYFTGPNSTNMMEIFT